MVQFKTIGRLYERFEKLFIQFLPGVVLSPVIQGYHGNAERLGQRLDRVRSVSGSSRVQDDVRRRFVVDHLVDGHANLSK